MLKILIVALCGAGGVYVCGVLGIQQSLTVGDLGAISYKALAGMGSAFLAYRQV